MYFVFRVFLDWLSRFYLLVFVWLRCVFLLLKESRGGRGEGGSSALSGVQGKNGPPDHTRKQINPSDAAIQMEGSPPHKRFLVGCSSPFTRLAGRFMALHAWCKQCLPVRWNPTCPASALQGRDGIAMAYGQMPLQPCMTWVQPLPFLLLVSVFNILYRM